MTVVSGRPLPQQIQDAIDNGTWVLPAAPETIERVFTQTASSGAKLYSVRCMISETEAWADESEEQLAYYGGPGADADGYLILNPKQSVLIGDLGHDMPIALDFGLSPDQPRVLYLPSSAPGWIEVAPDVPTFMEILGLGPSR